MKNRVLLKATASENCISFRTVSRSRKSPKRFYITRDEFAMLEAQASITTHDGWSFAVLRRDTKADTLEIQFTWLSGGGDGLSGWEETVTVPYGRLAAFVRESAQEGGPKEWKVLSIDLSGRRPKLMFDAKKTLRAILNNGVVRRKLVRFLRDGFNWPRSEQIRLYSDFVPYSFFFREIQGGEAVMCGGLILHGQEDMSKAYYSVHT